MAKPRYFARSGLLSFEFALLVLTFLSSFSILLHMAIRYWGKGVGMSGSALLLISWLILLGFGSAATTLIRAQDIYSHLSEELDVSNEKQMDLVGRSLSLMASISVIGASLLIGAISCSLLYLDRLFAQRVR